MLKGIAVLVLGALHQEIHALRVRHNHDLRLGIDLEVVADVPKRGYGLPRGVVDVIDDFVGRDICRGPGPGRLRCGRAPASPNAPADTPHKRKARI